MHFLSLLKSKIASYPLPSRVSDAEYTINTVILLIAIVAMHIQ